MNLSDRQVRIVNAFLRDVALDTPPEPPSARTRVLTRIRHQLRDELARRDDSPLHDEDLIRLLNRIQFPDRAARADKKRGDETRASAVGDGPASNGISGGNSPAGGVAIAVVEPPVRVRPAHAVTPAPLDETRPRLSGPLASSQRVWLGACIAISDRFGMPVEHVRAIAVGAGLLTGPLAVALYLAAYAVCYLGEHGDGAPRIDRMRLLRSVGTLLAAIVSMGVGFALAIGGVDFAHRLAIGYPPDADQWSAFSQGVNRLLVFSAVCLLPIAAVRGLPVAPPWDVYLARSLRSALAGLGVLIALAFASYHTGALLSGVRDWPA